MHVRQITLMVATLASVMFIACDKTDNPTSSQPANTITKAACLGFNITVTGGPDSARRYDGDLIMNIASDGYFVGALVPPDTAVERTLTITDSSTIIAKVTGQVNGAAVDWILYPPGDSTIFGSGMIDIKADPQTLRGITNGPSKMDLGVFHGRWFPPYIRTVS